VETLVKFVHVELKWWKKIVKIYQDQQDRQGSGFYAYSFKIAIQVHLLTARGYRDRNSCGESILEFDIESISNNVLNKFVSSAIRR